MDDKINLRQGNITDADAIASLTRDAYAKWVPVIGREPLPMLVDYAEAVRQHHFDLLFAGQVLAALIETVPQEDTLLIVNVAVRPLFQGLGYGKRLLHMADDRATELGLRGTRLFTNKAFAANLALYASLGYCVDREEPFRGGVTVYLSKLRAA
jgi:ribosomal protein S18 acetylase RimI-like enzyme